MRKSTYVDYFLEATSRFVFSMNSLSNRSPSVSFGGGAVLPELSFVLELVEFEFPEFPLAVVVLESYELYGGDDDEEVEEEEGGER